MTLLKITNKKETKRLIGNHPKFTFFLTLQEEKENRVKRVEKLARGLNRPEFSKLTQLASQKKADFFSRHKEKLL